MLHPCYTPTTRFTKLKYLNLDCHRQGLVKGDLKDLLLAVNLQKVNLTGCGLITGRREDLEKELEKRGRKEKLELFIDEVRSWPVSVNE